MKKDEINLPLVQYRLNAVAKQRFELPAYTGSAWRGVFGHALREAACVTAKPECKGCLFYQSCVYSYLFETPPPVGGTVMRKYTSAPHPFVLHPDPNQSTVVNTGDRIQLGFTLFGDANQHLPYFLYAFEKAGELGLGAGRGQYQVTELLQHAGTWQSVYTSGGTLQGLPTSTIVIPACPSGTVTMTFETPMRLRIRERDVTPKTLDFYAMFSVIMRRLSLLRQFHTNQPLEIDFKYLSDQAKVTSIIDKSLYWQDWLRYSSRQKTPIKMSGLMGSLTLDGESLKDFWEILYMGQLFHGGKNATMGLGRYTLSV